MTDRATSEVFATAFLLRGRENFGTKSTATRWRASSHRWQSPGCAPPKSRHRALRSTPRTPRATPASIRVSHRGHLRHPHRPPPLESPLDAPHPPDARPARTSSHCLELFGLDTHPRFHLMGRNATGFYGRDILSTTIKVQCNAHHSDTGRGSSSIAEGALPYDVVHLAGGGRA